MSGALWSDGRTIIGRDMLDGQVHFRNGQRGTILAGLALCALASVAVIVTGGFFAWSIGGVLVGLAWVFWTA